MAPNLHDCLLGRIRGLVLPLFFRGDPLYILNRSIDDRLVLAILGVITIVALVLTDVWLNVLVSILMGALIVGLQGTRCVEGNGGFVL
ncbi:hypothetical protein Goarm_016479, partial [Gossypium armourianum]|nr:hypothetical protein [Gossypium armourianum]